MNSLNNRRVVGFYTHTFLPDTWDNVYRLLNRLEDTGVEPQVFYRHLANMHRFPYQNLTSIEPGPGGQSGLKTWWATQVRRQPEFAFTGCAKILAEEVAFWRIQALQLFSLADAEELLPFLQDNPQLPVLLLLGFTAGPIEQETSAETRQLLSRMSRILSCAEETTAWLTPFQLPDTQVFPLSSQWNFDKIVSHMAEVYQAQLPPLPEEVT